MNNIKKWTIAILILTISLSIGCKDGGSSSSSSSSSEETEETDTVYPYFWSSTTHVEGNLGNYACYISFWEALGYMETSPGSEIYELLDVHGAGAQRSDPKTGNPDDYPTGHGPQGDVIHIYNFVRCVRDAGIVAGDYPIVDTNQIYTYNSEGLLIAAPASDETYYGQDAQYTGNSPSYTDNGDGTITDNNTGLTWQQTPENKMTWQQASDNASTINTAGYTDWRLPTIKELYSLMNYSGYTGYSSADSQPYISTAYFDFEYGDTSIGERFIDAQYWSATSYTSTTMWGNETAFGVNFADGRIKGYGKTMTAYVRYVRGNTNYGKNNLIDNGDGTITDLATGLMWMQQDSGHLKAGPYSNGTMAWQEALEWAETLEYAGYSDWRMPNIKELHSIIDYTRSPDTTGTAAIDPLFQISTSVEK